MSGAELAVFAVADEVVLSDPLLLDVRILELLQEQEHIGRLMPKKKYHRLLALWHYNDL